MLNMCWAFRLDLENSSILLSFQESLIVRRALQTNWLEVNSSNSINIIKKQISNKTKNKNLLNHCSQISQVHKAMLNSNKSHHLTQRPNRISLELEMYLLQVYPMGTTIRIKCLLTSRQLRVLFWWNSPGQIPPLMERLGMTNEGFVKKGQISPYVKP